MGFDCHCQREFGPPAEHIHVPVSLPKAKVIKCVFRVLRRRFIVFSKGILVSTTGLASTVWFRRFRCRLVQLVSSPVVHEPCKHGQREQLSQDDTFISPTATYADSFSGGFLLPPPATVNVSTFKPAASKVPGSFAPPVKKGNVLLRSKSTSFLLEYRRSSTISSSGDSNRRPDNEEIKRYMKKFVSLVIVRETTALARAQQVES